MTDRRMTWTETSSAALLAMWGDGVTTREIAAHLGVSRNAVIGRAHRMGLPPRPSPIGIAASKPVRRRRPVTRPVPVPVVIVVPPPLPPVRTCQFPFGHPKDRGFRFCEAVLQGGGVYCREHLALCYGSRRDLAA